MAITVTELTGVSRQGERISRNLYTRIVNVALSAETYVSGGLVVAHKMKTLKIAKISGPGTHLFAYDHANSKLMIYSAVGTQVTGSQTISNIMIEFVGTK